jgi:hypothetical protein
MINEDELEGGGTSVVTILAKVLSIDNIASSCTDTHVEMQITSEPLKMFNMKKHPTLISLPVFLEIEGYCL